MIRPCHRDDFETIYQIINDAAQAYRGVIPPDRWREPYMPRDELAQAIAQGVVFCGYEESGKLIGVMGIQHVQDVTLIRHAYVRTAQRHQGVGSRLLKHLCAQTDRPILVGTWADAAWAVAFYQKHGFRPVTPQQKDRLLPKYWGVPARQIETSVVLADPRWHQHAAGNGHPAPDSLQVVIEKDQFAKLLGLKIVEASEGSAKVTMQIGPQHLNGLGAVHGGAIFTLADYAFAAACNSHGFASVGINVSISYLKAAKEGTLTAHAQEAAPHRRLGSCTVRITDDHGDLVAIFQGLSYKKG